MIHWAGKKNPHFVTLRLIKHGVNSSVDPIVSIHERHRILHLRHLIALHVKGSTVARL